MKSISLPLRNNLPDEIVAVIKTVSETADSLRISALIVGATARDIILHGIYNIPIRRATEDIDFGIAVGSWAEYEKLKETLLKSTQFKADTKATHRLWHNSGSAQIKIDLVPFGKLESPTGQIAFPPGDFVMTTRGFEEVLGGALLIEIGKELTVRVASLAGIALLKIIAFGDRPHERRRDPQDIWFIIQNYLDAGNVERLYESGGADTDLMNDDFDYVRTGAELLGRDVGRMLNERTGQIVSGILSEENENAGLYKFAEVIAGSDGFYGEFEEIVNVLQKLKNGIERKIS